ncbi:DUF4238 domain-containing protein [Nocardia wallacei]|uniref:DUF4238 domain-containing protein n=1 Tax=Nocardia wallacei TaxID=480035 RepID=UPI0024573E71|nr:DUF4238 domain-containing protein [Nocardia wallacei]
MGPGLLAQLAAMRFDHPWLDDAFAEESRRLAVHETGKEHHYVPKFYLDRWAIEALIQPTLVDTGSRQKARSPRMAARERQFYTLPSTDDTMDLPLKWVETHLGRIETPCAHRFTELDEHGAGKVTDAGLKRDLAVFLGLQRTRTPSQRDYTLLIVTAPRPIKKEFLRRILPTASPAELDAACRNRYADDKHEAIHLMLSDVKNVLARSMFRRWWAVYETEAPLITCDDPVIALAGPPLGRSAFLGFRDCAAVLYPLDPHHLLVLLRPDLRHRGPFTLTEDETRAINREIAAAATKTTFERTSDHIAADLDVPARQPVTPLTDHDVASMDRQTALATMLHHGTPRNRWASDPDHAPAWPIPRWYG